MATPTGLNLNLRTDATPQQLLKELLLSPLIYIRLVGILCSIIVFGCVADKGNVDVGTDFVCAYNGSGACSFAIAVGVIGFLLCLVFLVKDVIYVIVDYSENLVVKKVILLVDAVTNGIWAFMWFVCFCYTDNQLRINMLLIPPALIDCVRAAVAFSFFCILIWVAIVVINIVYFVLIMRRSHSQGQSGYASFPEGPSDQSYRPTFAETKLYGRKRWFLYPPDHRPTFHPDITTLHWVTFTLPHLPKELQPMEYTLQPWRDLILPGPMVARNPER